MQYILCSIFLSNILEFFIIDLYTDVFEIIGMRIMRIKLTTTLSYCAIVELFYSELSMNLLLYLQIYMKEPEVASVYGYMTLNVLMEQHIYKCTVERSDLATASCIFFTKYRVISS